MSVGCVWVLKLIRTSSQLDEWIVKSTLISAFYTYKSSNVPLKASARVTDPGLQYMQHKLIDGCVTFLANNVWHPQILGTLPGDLTRFTWLLMLLSPVTLHYLCALSCGLYGAAIYLNSTSSGGAVGMCGTWHHPVKAIGLDHQLQGVR